MEHPQIVTAPEGAASRLAELVAHLTDCPPALAVRAVTGAGPGGPDSSMEARLALVARAMVQVRRQYLDIRGRRPA